MNRATEWRLERARRVAAVYAENPKLAALVVAGSVGTGRADELSDTELDLYWDQPPTDEDRRSVIERVQGEIVYYMPLEDDEWSDAYLVDGLKIEVSSFLVPTIDRYVADVMERYDTATEKQLRFAALQHSIPLHGEDLVHTWRERIAPYPDQLAENLIREHVGFWGWGLVELCVERGDLLLGYNMLTKVQLDILVVLLALNRTYLAHPRGKWLIHVCEGMRIKPARLAERMLFALRQGSLEGAREMDGVISETLALVEREFAQIDLTDIRRNLSLRRPRVGPAA